MTKKVNNPHDVVFKKTLSDIRVTKALIKQFLPQDLQAAMDLRTLKLSQNSFVTEELKQKISDVVYTVKVSGRTGYICLIIEHQRSADRWMTLRLHNYTLRAMDLHHKQHPKALLPLVHTLVVYNGQRPFKHSTDIRDDIDAPRELVDAHFLKPFQLLDLTQLKDEELRSEMWSGFLLLSLKHAMDRELVKQFKNIILDIARYFVQKGEQEYTWDVLKYLVQASKATTKDLEQLEYLVSDELSDELGGKMATLAENLRAEGYHKGQLDGRDEGMGIMAKGIARKLLMQKNASVESIAQLTDLPVSVIKNIQKDIQGKY